MDVDDENKVDKNETNDKPKAKGKGASSGKSLGLLKKQWHHVPVIVVGLVGIAILVAAVAGLFISFDSEEESNEPSLTLDSMYKETELTYGERADQMAFYGNYDEAQWILDEGLDKSEGNNTVQGEFYIKKTYVSLNASEFEDALTSALKAEDKIQSVETAALVALTAEALDDKLTAVDHWTLAADRTPEEQKNPGSFNGEYGYYLSRIEALGGVYSE